MKEQNSPNTATKQPFGQKIKNYFVNKWARIKAMNSKEWVDFLLNNAIYFIIIIFILVAIIYDKAVNNNNFLSLKSIMINVEIMSYKMFIALGVGGIIILTGTDLSAGRIVGITACLAASFLQSGDYLFQIFPGMGPWTAVLGGFGMLLVIIIVMIVGGAIGAFNGFFVAKFKLHPFIVTLATQIMLAGIVVVFCSLGTSKEGKVGGTIAEYGEKWVRGDIVISGKVGVDAVYLRLYTIYAIIAVGITWFMWNYTTFGKNMYAVGSNPEAANVSGINVNKTIIMVFVFAGLLYGFSGWVEGGRGISPSTGTGVNMELDAIAACVIGGVSFTGGIGKIKGIVLGVVIIQLISYGLGVFISEASIREIIKGALILFAVTIDMRKYITKR